METYESFKIDVRKGGLKFTIYNEPGKRDKLDVAGNGELKVKDIPKLRKVLDALEAKKKEWKKK